MVILSLCVSSEASKMALFFCPNILITQDKSANFVCLKTSAAALLLGILFFWLRGKHIPSS